MAEPDGGDVLERWRTRMESMNGQTPTDPGDAEVLERWRERLKNIHELCPNIEPDNGVLEKPSSKVSPTIRKIFKALGFEDVDWSKLSEEERKEWNELKQHSRGGN